MEIKHFAPSDYPVSIWSGGKTTELFIAPENATLAERNFDVRISTASIEVETSTFTSMNGYLRKLLVLEGSLELHHEGQHSVKLAAFEQNAFSGDWKTKSIGKAIDFNVIYKSTLHPEVSLVFLEKGDSIKCENGFIYVYEGELSFTNLTIESKSSIYTSEIVKLKVTIPSTIVKVNFKEF